MSLDSANEIEHGAGLLRLSETSDTEGGRRETAWLMPPILATVSRPRVSIPLNLRFCLRGWCSPAFCAGGGACTLWGLSLLGELRPWHRRGALSAAASAPRQLLDAWRRKRMFPCSAL